MTKISLSGLLLIDGPFLENRLLTPEGMDLLMKLMRININSRDHHRNHCRISGKTLDLAVSKRAVLASGMDLIRAGVKRIDDPTEIESIGDEMDRTVRHSISMASSLPFKTFLLTTDELVGKYATNSHLVKTKSLVIPVAGQAADHVVNTLFEECMDKDSY